MKSKRVRVQTKLDPKSMTQQHMKEQCDVNSILERYRKTGHLNHVRTSPGQYGDFTNFQDFKSNIDRVMDAQDQFQQLPAVIRKRFGNDPAQLIEFCLDPSNNEEAIKLGLANKPAQNDDKTTITQGPTQDQA